MKTYVGIDVSKDKLNAHVLGAKSPTYTFANSEGSIKSFAKKLNVKKYVIGVESTSNYHLLAEEYFVNSGFEFRVINPILTGNKINASIRKKKTDKSDAKLIAGLLVQGEGKLITKEDLDLTRRTMLRIRKRLVDKRTSFKVMIQDLKRISKVSPEVNFTIKSVGRIVKKLDEEIKKMEGKIKESEYDLEEDELIKSIPGFAEVLSRTVTSEVRDFSRFSSARKFKAYVGLDPRVKQSGDSLYTGKITKRGNVYLRSALYLAAQVARQHDPQLKAFYAKKKFEGKATRVCICAVAGKLCDRVLAVVRSGNPYQINRSSLV